jgi:hypothetical protein
MELMGRLTATPRGASIVGTVITLIAAVAIFFLGAPAWVLLPIMIVGFTVYAELGFWVDRRLGRRL